MASVTTSGSGGEDRTPPPGGADRQPPHDPEHAPEGPRAAHYREVDRNQEPGPGRLSPSSPAVVVYALLLVSLISGITAVIGVVVAYLYRGKGPPWLDSHYTFQIRTFWLLLLGSLIGGALTLVLVGWLVLAALAVWLIVRCVKGLQVLGRNEPYPDPETWTW
jgi:uncharacterized membrane protein